MELNIEIACDNAATQTGPQQADIIRQAAQQVADGWTSGSLKDSNGNTVGTFWKEGDRAHTFDIGSKVRRTDIEHEPVMTVAAIEDNGDLMLSYGGHTGWRVDPSDVVCASDWCDCDEHHTTD